MNRDEKASIISELIGSFGKSKFAVVADYCGLTVSQLQNIRINLRKCDAEIRIAKNTFLKRAVADTPNSCLTEDFSGTTAVVLAYSDLVGPAKIVTKFAEDNEKFIVRSAALDGERITMDGVQALSRLPGREVLLGQLLSVMNAVPTGLVQVLSAVPRTFLYALQAINDKKSASDN